MVCKLSFNFILCNLSKAGCPPPPHQTLSGYVNAFEPFPHKKMEKQSGNPKMD